MALIRINVGTEPTTGKKVKAELTYYVLDNFGRPDKMGYLLKFYEIDNTTDAVPTDSSIQKRAVASVEETFMFGGSINSGSLVYSPLTDESGSIVDKAIDIKEYFETHVINQLPGVGGGDQYWKTTEGVLKRVIDIKQANGELPS